MRKNPKLLIIGVDAADRHVVQRWAADGTLPNFARLMQRSAWGDSKNPTGMVAGTVWPTFYSSILPGRTGRFRGTVQFESGTYNHADLDLEKHGLPTFWDELAKAGRRSLIIDAPLAFLSRNKQVTQLVDWCAHAPWKDDVTVSQPADLREKVRTKYGRDPVGKCDFVAVATVDDVARFRDGLIERIGMRTDLTIDYLQNTDVDLFMHAYSECHCAGHQLWHLHDPAHPMHDTAMVKALGGDPMKAVYVALDAALGKILGAVDESWHTMIFLSHGMGLLYSGTHLLDEVLLRIEGAPSPRGRQRVAQHMVATWGHFPRDVRRMLTPLQKSLWPKLKANLVQPGKSKRRFFEIIINDAAGGVRLNVRGREPDGVVEPGADYEATCAMLEQELASLVDPVSGRRIVERIVRPQVIYPGAHADALPDLAVIWSREGPIKGAVSKRIGEVTQRFVFTNHRTGDHTEDDGLFFLVGPGVQPGRVPGIAVQDFAITIASMFGVVMQDVDGKVAASLYAAMTPANERSASIDRNAPSESRRVSS